MSHFYDFVTEYDFEPLEDLDITEDTAPTIEIFENAMQVLVPPVISSVRRFLGDRYPLLARFLNWKYRKQLKKVNEKYLGDGRGAEEFKKFKSYRLLLYRKANPKSSGGC